MLTLYIPLFFFMHMQCSLCDKKAVISTPALCKVHLIEYVHTTTKETIEKYDLCSKEQTICVAASGGKDSVALLVVLKEIGYDVHALAVDEGIEGYRAYSLRDLGRVTIGRSIPLHIVSFKKEFGKPLDAMIANRHPCSVCGVFRRYLLNKYAKEYEVIATGHNLDDEAQAVLMNLMKGSKDLLERTHVKTPKADGFVPRIKPFMFLPEKVIFAYAIMRGFDLHYAECPHVYQSLRAQVRDVLNRYEYEYPGMKLSLVQAGLHVSTKKTTTHFVSCMTCGEPSMQVICRACTLRKEIGDA